MAQVALSSRVRAREGGAGELIAAFGPVFELVENEPGTLIYALHRSEEDPDLFFVYELYNDQEAFRVHADSATMAAATPALAAAIAESDLVVGHPLHARGLPVLRSVCGPEFPGLRTYRGDRQ